MSFAMWWVSLWPLWTVVAFHAFIRQLELVFHALTPCAEGLYKECVLSSCTIASGVDVHEKHFTWCKTLSEKDSLTSFAVLAFFASPTIMIALQPVQRCVAPWRWVLPYVPYIQWRNGKIGWYIGRTIKPHILSSKWAWSKVDFHCVFEQATIPINLS